MQTVPVKHLNPLENYRAQHGLSRIALAQKLGISYEEITRCERGYPNVLPSRVLAALRELGADTDSIAKEYVDWRAARGRRIQTN